MSEAVICAGGWKVGSRSPSAMRRDRSEPSSSTMPTERLIASVTAPVGDDPELQFHEFSMQPGQFALVTLVVEFLPPFCAFFILGLAVSALAFCRTHCVPPVFVLYIMGAPA